MWELDYEESWAPKNWCFWIVVLEKTLACPLYCKEIQPVHPKVDQCWVFIGRTDAEDETPILWPRHAELNWCNSNFYSTGLYFYQQRHLQLCVFLLWPSHFFLELLVIALHSSPVPYWDPSDPGGSSSGGVSFYLFILFVRFLQQEYRSRLPFPSPVDYFLSDFFTMTCPSWVTAWHGS